MKTVLRILVILAVTAALSGLTLLVVNATGITNNTNLVSHEGSDFAPGQGRHGLDGGTGAGLRQEHDGLGMNTGGSSMTETIKNLIIVAAVVAVVALVERLAKAMRRKKAVPVTIENRPVNR